MKIKAGVLLSAYEVLVSAVSGKRDLHVNLPTKAAYRIARMIVLLEPEALVLRSKRFDVIKKHGEENKAAKGVWAVLPGKAADFEREWGEIAQDEIEVTCQPIPLSAMGDGESYFTVAELLLLGPLMEDS